MKTRVAIVSAAAIAMAVVLSPAFGHADQQDEINQLRYEMEDTQRRLQELETGRGVSRPLLTPWERFLMLEAIRQAAGNPLTSAERREHLDRLGVKPPRGAWPE